MTADENVAAVGARGWRPFRYLDRDLVVSMTLQEHLQAVFKRGDMCTDCEWCLPIDDLVPYQEGCATRHLRLCQVLENGIDPLECPALMEMAECQNCHEADDMKNIHFDLCEQCSDSEPMPGPETDFAPGAN